MKKLLLIPMFAVLVSLIGCGASGETTVTQVQTVIIKETGSSGGSSTTSASSSPAPAAGTFSGTSNLTTQKFALKAGAVRFNYKNTAGGGTFSVWLKDEQGNNTDLVVSVIGPAESSKVLNIKKDGNFMLDVRSDGNWTITAQPE